ncbi:hypothetical protein LSAT2_028551 [Lamellibrachia satsuma]|nr:hypothetical protein LSAT2_028551 [Lamellibrachia satsuma]
MEQRGRRKNDKLSRGRSQWNSGRTAVSKAAVVVRYGGATGYDDRAPGQMNFADELIHDGVPLFSVLAARKKTIDEEDYIRRIRTHRSIATVLIDSTTLYTKMDASQQTDTVMDLIQHKTTLLMLLLPLLSLVHPAESMEKRR